MVSAARTCLPRQASILHETALLRAKLETAMTNKKKKKMGVQNVAYITRSRSETMSWSRDGARGDHPRGSLHYEVPLKGGLNVRGGKFVPRWAARELTLRGLVLHPVRAAA